MSETLRIVLAGFGGQGVLFGGKVIAMTGLLEDRQVSWLPSYGPEMRGGTANCNVTLSDDPIGSPLVLDPNVLIALNEPSFLKFEESVVPGGIIIADSTMVKSMPTRTDVTCVRIPATKMAEDAGLKGLANIVLVGSLYAEKHFCERETLDKAIDAVVPARKAAMVEKNKQALELGSSFVADKA
ncbi:MAG: 2-oxoacid:acceptor oxidoreductase family protein [Eggerthellaceae bacterium]|jgi:2-oxoglutarate ferredoxin oxidoreductase subunit gamma